MSAALKTSDLPSGRRSSSSGLLARRTSPTASDQKVRSRGFGERRRQNVHRNGGGEARRRPRYADRENRRAGTPGTTDGRAAARRRAGESGHSRARGSAAGAEGRGLAVDGRGRPLQRPRPESGAGVRDEAERDGALAE